MPKPLTITPPHVITDFINRIEKEMGPQDWAPLSAKVQHSLETPLRRSATRFAIAEGPFAGGPQFGRRVVLVVPAPVAGDAPTVYATPNDTTLEKLHHSVQEVLQKHPEAHCDLFVTQPTDSKNTAAYDQHAEVFRNTRTGFLRDMRKAGVTGLSSGRVDGYNHDAAELAARAHIAKHGYSPDGTMQDGRKIAVKFAVNYDGLI